MPLRVLLVDDQLVFRSALCALLGTMSELEVVGEADDGESALKMAGSLAPDVVVMDSRLPGIDGIEATRRIRKAHPHTAVLMLSGFADEAIRRAAADAGASNVLDKGRGLGALLPEIQAAAKSTAS